MPQPSSPVAEERDRGEGSDLAAAYFEQLGERFERAAEAAGEASVDLEVGGLGLRLVFAGGAMREVLLPPFEHLAVDRARPPRLRIRAFDTASTGVEPPPPSWRPLKAEPGTNPVARLRSERACVLAAAGSGAMTAVAPASGEAVFHLPDAGQIAPSERAAPLREALALLMASHGRWMTHAGVVGRRGRGVLLAGRGGSGKSTLALACALAGMEIVADDYVLLETGPPRTHALQSTAKLTEDSVGRLGVGEGPIDPAGFEPTLEGPAKALVDIRALAPGTMRRRLEIAAVVAPLLPSTRSHFVRHSQTKCERNGSGDAEPLLQPVSAARGLRAIAPSTVVQSGAAGGESLAALAALVREVPSYLLRLGPDPVANAAAIDRLVDELG
jgi:hypothetical protein